ncbi:HIT domain protein [Candidatus Bilamarchaeum dharawalense]|uniref:HIT domain protein n=1 Tax=Candidatus Bilamarchaeum dharawalense TaxID=2885759 RepID=A0A5E4LQY1_9ARCH|nr:HIT domain protein [Candidatus Bilamarchaeum dharawalense]
MEIMENCIFCKIKDKQIPSFEIWSDDKFYAFLDINPISPGHTLLIPKQHVDYLFDIDEKQYSELFMTARKLAPMLKRGTGAKRIGIIVEGFLVPHAHIHLVPLNQGNQLNPANAKPMDKTELAKIAERIKNVL